jgi:MoaA/NifB/PqqE/SkfB family radical SAM enzyme
MCEIWKNRADDREEMSVRDVRKVFEGIGKLDAVRLSGGEPFIRRDFSDILHAIYDASAPRVVHITTNGILTDRIVGFMENVAHPERIHLKISIDAVGERNSVIRGIPHAYENAVETLDQLTPLKKKRGFVLGVNQTIVDRTGAEDAKELKKLCDTHGIGLYQVMAFDNKVSLYSKGEQLPNSYNRISSNFSKEELSKLFGDIKSSFMSEDVNERLTKLYYLKGLRNRMVGGRDSPRPACVELSSHVRLLPNGDIPICLIYNTIVGNAVRDDFNELWYGEKIRGHRRTIKDCEGCWVGCEIIPSAIYTGDIIKGLLP